MAEFKTELRENIVYPSASNQSGVSHVINLDIINGVLLTTKHNTVPTHIIKQCICWLNGPSFSWNVIAMEEVCADFDLNTIHRVVVLEIRKAIFVTNISVASTFVGALLVI